MDFRFTPDEQAFHKEVQDFINQLLPKEWIGVDPDGHNEQADEKLHQVDLQGRKALAAKGLQAIKLPTAIVEDPNFKENADYYPDQSDNFFVGNSFPTCGINFTAQEIMGQSKDNQ